MIQHPTMLSPNGTIMALFTANRLQQIFREWELSVPTEQIFAMLQQAYSEPHRFYHNIGHVENCLQQLHMHSQFVEHPLLVELALWFHDAVYDTHQKDNEEQSANLAVQVLTEAGLPEEQTKKIRDLILATCHNSSPKSLDAKLLVDIDLSILGSSTEQFERYDEQIRQEYSWVKEGEYREARKRVLRAFLERRSIYETDLYRNKYENRARENLRRVIQK